jgi:hypothetical protein
MSKSPKLKILFDASLRDYVLEAFGVRPNVDGLLVESKNPDQHVLTQDGQEVEYKRFGGVRKGSEVFMRDDIVSLIQFCEDARP